MNPDPESNPGKEMKSLLDYEILRLIGHGAYGEVYLARDAAGAYRAIKVIFRESFDHDRPFEREHEGIRKFEKISRSYDNQVQVFHVGFREEPRQFYYVMELADDENTGREIHPDRYVPKTLRSELKRRGRFPIQECLTIGTALARALASLHENGLIHRDVKPANVIFVHGRPKLADIGLVTDLAVTVSHVGTEGFIPPEGPGSPQADLYSLGKVLYELCTGHDRLEFPELPANLQQLPDRELLLELNLIIAKACALDPGQRYRTAGEMLADLIWLQQGNSLRTRRRQQRSLAFAGKVAAGMVLLGLAAFGMHYFLKGRPAQRTAGATPSPAVRAARWQEARFGLFIHWGLYSVPGDASGSIPDSSWYYVSKRTQMSDYEKFADGFTAEKFNARDWVSAARNAGMKYIVITAKHHEGFCLFDSRLTRFDVVEATRFKRDPLKELADECRRQNVRLGFFYSIMDWHHPDYLPRRNFDTRPAAGADFGRYVDYMHGQVRELLANYGPVAVMWFDSTNRHSTADLRADQLERLVRTLQPGALINSRFHPDAARSDFDTFEKKIPSEPLSTGRPWETCMTMGRSWGYDRNESQWKTSAELIRDLCRAAHSGGNFLLNVGPTAEGEFPPECSQRLADIGAWMKVHADAIHGTQPGPFVSLPATIRCTAKDTRLFLLVFNWPSDGLLAPGLRTPVKRARTLAGEKLSVSADAEGRGMRIARPAQLDAAATVVELQFDETPRVEN